MSLGIHKAIRRRDRVDSNRDSPPPTSLLARTLNRRYISFAVTIRIVAAAFRSCAMVAIDCCRKPTFLDWSDVSPRDTPIPKLLKWGSVPRRKDTTHDSFDATLAFGFGIILDWAGFVSRFTSRTTADNQMAHEGRICELLSNVICQFPKQSFVGRFDIFLWK